MQACAKRVHYDHSPALYEIESKNNGRMTIVAEEELEDGFLFPEEQEQSHDIFVIFPPASERMRKGYFWCY